MSRTRTSTKRLVLAVLAVALVSFAATACVPPPPSGEALGIIAAMNADRAANGLAPLTYNHQLGVNGEAWAQHLAAANAGLVHQNLGTEFADPAYAPFRTLGENLLSGPGNMSPGQMEASWMASPPHRANILNGNYKWAGPGYATAADGSLYVTVEFGG